jgi:hypothetical protein
VHGQSIPQAVRESVLGDLLRDIDTRKELDNKHYADLHASLLAAFPGLVEVVGDNTAPK